jgi:CubicO group peptidase (beta-lactamase class C family)
MAPPGTRAPPTVPEGLDRIGALLDAAVASDRIPGAVAVAGRGPVTLGHWAVGQADAIRGRPMHADTIFDLASLTKVVATTTVTLALASRGQLGLGEPVAGYLPGLAACRDGRVTIAHLLTHTSGLPGSRTFYRWCGSRAELLRDLCQTPLDAPPGSRVAYSDLGFIALGEVVAAAAGEPLDVAVRHLVTGPLGLDSTEFNPNGPPDCFAATERRDDGTAWTGTVHDENARLMGGVAGHAGLFAPVREVDRIVAELLACYAGRSEFVPQKIMQQFWARDTAVRGSTWALGWDSPSPEYSSSGRRFSPAAVGHLGFTGTSVWIEPARGIAISLLTNRVHPRRDNQAIRDFRPKIHDLIMEALGVNG